MTIEPTYSVKNWEEFQHYKDRDPPWVKLHRNILTGRTWLKGTDLSRVVQVASIAIAARYSNKIPLDFEVLQPAMGLRCTQQQFEAAIEYLQAADFIEIQRAPVTTDVMEQGASSTLAKCSSETQSQSDIPTTSGADAPLKDQIFGPCLEWLAKRTGKPANKLRAVVGKWCSRHGDGATLEAINAAAKNCPLGDPIAYIEAVLKPKGGDGPALPAEDNRPYLRYRDYLRDPGSWLGIWGDPERDTPEAVKAQARKEVGIREPDDNLEIPDFLDKRPRRSA